MIVWGHSYDLTPLGKVPLDCPKCGKAPMVLNLANKRFTLYWIPTFSMSECHALTCPHCADETLYEVKPELVEDLKLLAQK